MDSLLLSHEAQDHNFDWNLGIFDESDTQYLEYQGLFSAFSHDCSVDETLLSQNQDGAGTSHEASSDDGEQDLAPLQQPRLRKVVTRTPLSRGHRPTSLPTVKTTETYSKELLAASSLPLDTPVVQSSSAGGKLPHNEGTRRSSRFLDAPWKPEWYSAGDSETKVAEGCRVSLTGRRKATEEARAVLMDWINANRGKIVYIRNVLWSFLKMNMCMLVSFSDHPYPSRAQKAELAVRTGLTVPQIVHWMSNVRKRRLIPLLRQVNPSLHLPTSGSLFLPILYLRSV